VSSSGAVIEGSYDYGVVVLSAIIAVLSSLAALELAGKFAISPLRPRGFWLVGWALTQGAGIWSMHYTGMLAFRLPLPTKYDWPTALLSFVIAMAGAACTILVVRRYHLSAVRLAIGSLFSGAAIVGQHYTAMASMRASAMCIYSVPLVILSAVFAVGFSLLSLWLVFALRSRSTWRRLRQIGAALLMGAAIVLMHYTGMAAATFLPSGTLPDWSHAVSISSLGILAVGGSSIAWLATAVIMSIIDQRRHANSERERSLRELHALTGELQRVREEERTSVAREIHDELGQALTSINLDLMSLAHELPPHRPEQDRIESIRRQVDATIHSVRRIATELRPALLDDLGLVAAVEWAARDFETRTHIACRLSLPAGDLTMTPDQATTVFRIFQEALTNIARHSGATEVDVHLAEDDQAVVLRVHDNGRGFDETQIAARGSLGIVGMRERAAAAGGELTVHGIPGEGTSVSLRVPA
jgi:signal transduction histidine kinase